MNTQLKQKIEEEIESLSDLHMAAVLELVEMLKNKQCEDAQNEAEIAAALQELKTIIKEPPKGRLTAIRLDLTGFKFNREEANAR